MEKTKDIDADKLRAVREWIVKSCPELMETEAIEVRFSHCRLHNLDCGQCRALIHKSLSVALPDHSIGIETVKPWFNKIGIAEVLRAL